jgi:hypothetical protein
LRQTTLSVVLEVEPASAGRLSSLVEQFKKDQTPPASPAATTSTVPIAATTPSFQELIVGMPALHFMSISVFMGADYDPMLVIEVNFDYGAGPFWGQFEGVMGERIRPMLRCCKRPNDDASPLFDAVTAEGSHYPVAPYLERRTLQPSVYHHGNRGLSRDRVVREGDLFLATRTELSNSSYRGIPAEQIHSQLRAAMLGQFRWLGEAEEARITPRERWHDRLRLFWFLLVLLFVLSLPGFSFLIFLRAFLPSAQPWFVHDLPSLAWLLLLPLAVCYFLYRGARARRGEAAPSRSGGLSPSLGGDFLSLGNLYTLIFVGLIVVAAIAAVFGLLGAIGEAFYVLVIEKAKQSAVAAYDGAAGSGYFQALLVAGKAFRQEFERSIRYLFPAFFGSVRDHFNVAFRVALVGIYTAFFVSLPLVMLWLRWLERRDSHHDAPAIDQTELRKMERREDWVPQNHMGSIVLVKPGVLRTALFRAGHLGLGLVLRVVATDGYLGSMRTVHFAHWAFINNGSRLMFFSNFDQSWDSYLDDFIEKAHGGLTLAWGSCTGFPATRFLVMDGASHGRQFKAWARHSMAVSRVWYSAYPNYTVNQIDRHARIAEGLRSPTLSPQKAALWIKDL